MGKKMKILNPLPTPLFFKKINYYTKMAYFVVYTNIYR